MKKTKQIAIIGVLTAMYFVLSALLKIPVGGHITLDLGYIALTIGAVFLGAVPAAFIGGMGALLESAMMSARGISPGWILMNVIAGYCCGLVLPKASKKSKKEFVIAACIVVLGSLLVGAAVKTLIDCKLYTLPLAAKIPTGIIAWLCDSFVMLAMGLPLSMALKKQVKL